MIDLDVLIDKITHEEVDDALRQEVARLAEGVQEAVRTIDFYAGSAVLSHILAKDLRKALVGEEVPRAQD